MATMKRQLNSTAMSIPSSSPEIVPESSSEELLQLLRKLDLNVKSDLDDETASAIANLIKRINSKASAKHVFMTDKSHLSPTADNHLRTVTPDLIDPSLDALENPSDNETDDEFVEGDFVHQVPYGHWSRFSCKPIKMIVDGVKYFVHERIFELMFPNQIPPEGDDSFELSGIYDYLFEAALEYEYGRSIDILGELSEDGLGMLRNFAFGHGNMSLLAAIYQIQKVEVLEEDNLARVADIYRYPYEIPVFRGYFRDCLRQELPKRLEKGSSGDLVSSLANQLRGAGNAMEDVSMVLHELWVASNTTVRSLEDELAAQDNAKSLLWDNHNRSWVDDANKRDWVSHSGSDPAPNDGGESGLDEGVKLSSKWKTPTAYTAPSDPLPPQGDALNTVGSQAPTPIDPHPATTASPLQFVWGHRTSRRLNTPSFLPEPAPAQASSYCNDAAPQGISAGLQNTSALARCIYHWFSNQQRQAGSWLVRLRASEIASNVGCTEQEASSALDELLRIGLVDGDGAWNGWYVVPLQS